MSGQRILGIDPGLRVTGFGVIEQHGSQLVYVASGCIKSNDKQSLPERIATLFAGISEVIATYRPDQAAVEKVFVNVNPQSTLLLGQARGTAICAAVLAGLPVAEYTALQVKQAVVGKGHADKEQVQHGVRTKRFHRFMNTSKPSGGNTEFTWTERRPPLLSSKRGIRCRSRSFQYPLPYSRV